MLDQGPEHTMSSQPRAGRSRTGDIPPPSSFKSLMPQPAVADEGPSAATDRERDRRSPQAQTSTSVPIRTHQPERIEPMRPSLSLTQNPPRYHSSQTQLSSNAADKHAAQKTSISQEREVERKPLAMLGQVEDTSTPNNDVSCDCGFCGCHFCIYRFCGCSFCGYGFCNCCCCGCCSCGDNSCCVIVARVRLLANTSALAGHLLISAAPMWADLLKEPTNCATWVSQQRLLKLRAIRWEQSRYV
jgi:hypothetical protein